MFNKSAILTQQEKSLLKHALFLYQKNAYEKHGHMTTVQNDSLKHIVDALHL
jgi:hypothetical protein